MFSTLDLATEGRTRRGLAFTCGVLAQVLVIGAGVLIGILFPQELPLFEKHFALAWLPALTPPEKPVVEPPRKTARVVLPEQKSPEPPKALAFSVPEPEVPKPRPTISSIPTPKTSLPPLPVIQPISPPKVKEQAEVHTGIFGGAAEHVTLKRRVQDVQTGGFGSAQGLPGRAQGDSTGNVPKLGSFGLPEGPGTGNGTGGRHGAQGVVASAGFGSGIAGAGIHGDGKKTVVASAGFSSGVVGVGNGRGDGGPVTVGGFAKALPVAPAPAKNLQAPPPEEFQPIEILSKPSPVYTDDARRLKIQGDVTLSVVFLANGAIKIVGVLTSLGHGLDQAAEQAAAQIRFKPAKRAGQPTDFPATLHIEFRLADQAS